MCVLSVLSVLVRQRDTKPPSIELDVLQVAHGAQGGFRIDELDEAKALTLAAAMISHDASLGDRANL
eukprot:2280393-Pleurochrysis_carterae.AAC.2